MRLTSLLLAVILAPCAHAEEKEKRPLVTCPSIESLQVESQECEDNGNIGQAGIDCYQAFQGAVKRNSTATQVGMLALNAASTANKGNGQAQKFANSAADLDASANTLDSLIAAGIQARGNVDSYLHGIYYPDDYNMEDGPFQEMYGSADEFLDGEPCFYDNEQGLKGLLKRFDDDIAQLKRTRSAVQAMRTSSSGRETTTSSLNGAAAQGTSPSGTSALRGTRNGSTAHPASSITGVEQDKAKQSK